MNILGIWVISVLLQRTSSK